MLTLQKLMYLPLEGMLFMFTPIKLSFYNTDI